MKLALGTSTPDGLEEPQISHINRGRIKRILRQIPGVITFVIWIQQRYYFLCEEFGVHPSKDHLVNRAYWEKRSDENWEEDRLSEEIYQKATLELVELLSTMRWDTLLEVGCGFGRILKTLSAHFPHKQFTGADFSSNQFTRAKEYMGSPPNIKLVQADARNLPFQDKTFDIVLTSTLLIYIHPSELDLTLRELSRVGRSHLICMEYAGDGPLTKSEHKLAVTSPFYVHKLNDSLTSTGLKVIKRERMKSWQGHDNRFPLFLFLASIK